MGGSLLILSVSIYNIPGPDWRALIVQAGGRPPNRRSGHFQAIGNGGRDNGAPGLRPDDGATADAACVIDPDGYRIAAHCAAAA